MFWRSLGVLVLLTAFSWTPTTFAESRSEHVVERRAEEVLSRQEANLSREEDDLWTGLFQLAPRVIDGQIKWCAALKDDKTGKVILLRTYVDQSCSEAITACKRGALCAVKGKMSEDGLFVEEFHSFAKATDQAKADEKTSDALPLKKSSEPDKAESKTDQTNLYRYNPYGGGMGMGGYNPYGSGMGMGGYNPYGSGMGMGMGGYNPYGSGYEFNPYGQKPYNPYGGGYGHAYGFGPNPYGHY